MSTKDKQHAHDDGGDSQELAEDRHAREFLVVVQVIGQYHHDRRRGNPHQESELPDVESPGDVAAQDPVMPRP